ncbi:MAG: hypothetical protein A3D10_05635 [Omnitrophica WOR_2 bacterium RIFCSPHIGHO2_02_FULL_48_11]|nr:MAG: hypothetical protein A3D10_05635 [Omnitrophica WOR_2 bacterium RIFCSPHIGHO2_02_FULL_48_11]
MTDNLQINFFQRRQREVLRSMMEGTCLQVGGQPAQLPGNIPVVAAAVHLPYSDDSFDMVIWREGWGSAGPYKQIFNELLRIARKKVVVVVDRHDGYRKRRQVETLTGFDEVRKLFWFMTPFRAYRFFFRPRPGWFDTILSCLAKIPFNRGPVIIAVKNKIVFTNYPQNKISLFVPVYNEQNIIARDIRILDHVMKNTKWDYEIFIVNDASRDKTESVAKNISRENPRVQVVTFMSGPTRRENLAQAFKKAKGEIVAFVDIDLISSLRFLPDLLYQIIQGYDIVTGSRYLPRAMIRRRPFRHFISVIYNFVVRLLFRTGIADHMCGFKAFRREVILKLVEEMGYDHSLERGIFWDTELLIRARRRGYRVKEIPIWWIERRKSALSVEREVKSTRYILKFWKKILFS